MKILSIGNSFSQDAQRWLYSMCEADGIDAKFVNLFIGGCSLETHYNNMHSDESCYAYELNGHYVKQISLSAALEEDDWDVVTLQQASHLSGIEDSYFPYIEKLSEYISQKAPNAKQYIHKTWAYEIDSNHGGFAYYAHNQKRMFALLSHCYKVAASSINAQIIPVGDVIQSLREHTREFNYQNGGKSLCRDGFHLSWIYGRYTAAAVWYSVFFGKDVRENQFVPSNESENADLSIIAVIKENVYNFMKGYANEN